MRNYHLNGSTASSTLTFSQGHPITFSYNWYSAVGSSANIQASPQIANNYFKKNNQSNGNRPQINMGPSGIETLRITGNTIIGDITSGISLNGAGNATSISVSNNQFRRNL